MKEHYILLDILLLILEESIKKSNNKYINMKKANKKQCTHFESYSGLNPLDVQHDYKGKCPTKFMARARFNDIVIIHLRRDGQITGVWSDHVDSIFGNAHSPSYCCTVNGRIYTLQCSSAFEQSSSHSLPLSHQTCFSKNFPHL